MAKSKVRKKGKTKVVKKKLNNKLFSRSMNMEELYLSKNIILNGLEQLWQQISEQILEAVCEVQESYTPQFKVIMEGSNKLAVELIQSTLANLNTDDEVSAFIYEVPEIILSIITAMPEFDKHIALRNKMIVDIYKVGQEALQISILEAKEELADFNMESEIKKFYNKKAKSVLAMSEDYISFLLKELFGAYTLNSYTLVEDINSLFREKAEFKYYCIETENGKELKIRIDVTNYIANSYSEVAIDVDEPQISIVSDNTIKFIDSYRELNDLALKHGFTYVRANGDHGIYKREDGKLVIIPQGRPIGKGLSLRLQKDILSPDIQLY